MTQDQYNRAGQILEQISKLKRLRGRIFDTYEKRKTDKELSEVLDDCLNVVDVLIEIDEKKFKEI
jgi:phage-related tail protein